MFVSPLLFSALLSLPGLESGAVLPTPVDRTVLAMGTELRLHLVGGQDPVKASETALAESARIEAACSTWNPDSSWSQLNAAQGHPVKLDAEWIALLREMQHWSQRTDGAFDPVLMAMMRAWGIRTGGRTPSPEERLEARQASGARLLALDEAAGTARLLSPWAGVEEGGFLKGYALDRMRKASSVPRGWIDFGGQVLAWGETLPVAIADPLNRHHERLRIRLSNASLSCSGASERGRHILDPRRGEPCEAWGATAVVAPEALTADVLSTALYVLGPEAGLAWAENHDVPAAFLLNDGRIRMSRTFLSFHPTLIP
jgi:thiamine biosynthesis lipoprotein